uniref:Chromogranin-A n=1 Tax=Sphenodon punctatus TaxID=8508 RepID=A0A8D0G0D2_SPHPU
LPVTNPTNKSDSKVMKCIVEVISDTLSKPNPLPISRECLETLKGGTISPLRVLLFPPCDAGASERTEQQEKNGGFEDELSEVLEKQNDRSVQRGWCPPNSHGYPPAWHRSEDDVMQEEDTSHPRESKSEEMEEEPSKEWEDSKRWNKMDELAKQLTTKKRAEENDNAEDPDRSMKMSFRSHKYDFHNPEETVRSSWKRHSKEDSSEGAFPLVAVPEEKKDEEGSANRRTEDQELESLAAIEAELEKVAHKLHELRKG